MSRTLNSHVHTTHSDLSSSSSSESFNAFNNGIPLGSLQDYTNLTQAEVDNYLSQSTQLYATRRSGAYSRIVDNTGIESANVISGERPDLLPNFISDNSSPLVSNYSRAIDFIESDFQSYSVNYFIANRDRINVDLISINDQISHRLVALSTETNSNLMLSFLSYDVSSIVIEPRNMLAAIEAYFDGFFTLLGSDFVELLFSFLQRHGNGTLVRAFLFFIIWFSFLQLYRLFGPENAIYVNIRRQEHAFYTSLNRINGYFHSVPVLPNRSAPSGNTEVNSLSVRLFSRARNFAFSFFTPEYRIYTFLGIGLALGVGLYSISGSETVITSTPEVAAILPEGITVPSPQDQESVQVAASIFKAFSDGVKAFENLLKFLNLKK